MRLFIRQLTAVGVVLWLPVYVLYRWLKIVRLCDILITVNLQSLSMADGKIVEVAVENENGHQ